MHVLKTIGKSVREYKTPSVLAPIFIVVEVVMETVIPMIMSKLIDEFANGMNPVLKYGAILLAMAVASLISVIESPVFFSSCFACSIRTFIRYSL